MSEKYACPHIETIITTKKMAKDLEHAVFEGNGFPPIQKSVTEMLLIIPNLSDKVDKLTTAVSGLTKAYQNSITKEEVKKEIKQDAKSDKKWKVTTIVSVILATVGIFRDQIVEFFTEFFK